MPRLLPFVPRRVRLALCIAFAASGAQAQGVLQGTWSINLDGQLAQLYLTHGADGSLFGSITVPGQPGEPAYGHYAAAERRFVLLRGHFLQPHQAYTQPAQVLIGEWSPAAVWRGFQIAPPRLTGRFHGLMPSGGALPARNAFAFSAAPQGQIVPALPAVSAGRPGELCLRNQSVFFNRPAEYGLGWTATLRFDLPNSGCATGTVSGWFDNDRIRGFYAPGAGLVVFQRTFSWVGGRPNQVYVGRAEGGELVVGGLCGEFYALDAYGGASMQRMSYDWKTDYWAYGAPAGVTGCH